MTHRSHGFTLIEILAASLIAAMVIVAVYSIFQRTVKTRDNAIARIHEARQRERAVGIIRNDLRNAFLSGGALANAMEGGVQNQKSRFPGYLRFTATTGRNKTGEAYGDVQQIEYYLTDPDTTGTPINSGTSSTETATLVRALTRDLLSADQTATAPEEPLLPRVQTLEVTFFDGQAWQESWQLTGTDSTLPQAVRLRVQQAPASERLTTPPVLEILVPLTTEAMGSTASSSATPAGRVTPTPSPTPSATPSPSPSPTPSPSGTPRPR